MFLKLYLKFLTFKDWFKRNIVVILLLSGLISILGGIVIGVKMGGEEGKAFTKIFSDFGLALLLIAIIVKIYRWRKNG